MSGSVRVGFVFAIGTGVLIIILLSWVVFVGLATKHSVSGVGPATQADRAPTCVSRNCAMRESPDAQSAAMRRTSTNVEDEMEIVYGRIREALPASNGEISGFVIDGGLEVHFPKDRAKQVAALVSLGSRLEICGNPYRGPSGDPHIEAKFITNLDSKRSVNLQDSPPWHEPEMSSLCAPTLAEATSLAPPQMKDKTKPRNPYEGKPRPACQLNEVGKRIPRGPISHPRLHSRTPLGACVAVHARMKTEPRDPSSWRMTAFIDRRLCWLTSRSSTYKRPM